MIPIDFKGILRPEQIKTDADSVAYYGKDWTTYFDINARAILFPESIVDVQNIVLWANEHNVALVPSGGRTGLSGAAVAKGGEIVVSFERMNKILNYNSIDRLVTCQPGVVIEELQQFALEKNLFYPIDFAARGSSHIAGSIATNAGGIKVLRYGMTRDWVAGLKVITGTGEILDLNRGLIKNATGYDLRHLFIGSEGTLGFIVEATLKLASRPPASKTLLLAIPTLEQVMAVYQTFKDNTVLTAFEMFSDKALGYVLESTGLPAPFSQNTPFYTVLEIECPSETDEANILDCFEKSLEKETVTDGLLAQSEEQAKIFWRYREQISESLARFSPYKNDLSVRISNVPGFVEKLDKVLANAYPNWSVVWFGHIGDGNLHINILRPQGMSKEDFVRECQKVDALVFQVTQQFEGSISAEHGVGLTKKPFLTFSRSPEEVRLLKQIKTIFDPKNLINPGKIFD
jgi:FAD/FMN-containing dehydrogenase